LPVRLPSYWFPPRVKNGPMKATLAVAVIAAALPRTLAALPATVLYRNARRRRAARPTQLSQPRDATIKTCCWICSFTNPTKEIGLVIEIPVKSSSS
jgi:hypothetical protein